MFLSILGKQALESVFEMKATHCDLSNVTQVPFISKVHTVYVDYFYEIITSNPHNGKWPMGNV